MSEIVMNKESKELSLDELYKEQRAPRNEYYNTDNVELLSQPEQEPVAWRKDHDGHGYSFRIYDNGGEPLYTAPKIEKESEAIDIKIEWYTKGYKQGSEEQPIRRGRLTATEIVRELKRIGRTLDVSVFEAGVAFAEKAHDIGVQRDE